MQARSTFWLVQSDEWFLHLGVSENSVALNPMVLLIIIPMKNGYFIGNIPNIFRQTHLYEIVQRPQPDQVPIPGRDRLFAALCSPGTEGADVVGAIFVRWKVGRGAKNFNKNSFW